MLFVRVELTKRSIEARQLRIRFNCISFNWFHFACYLQPHVFRETLSYSVSPNSPFLMVTEITIYWIVKEENSLLVRMNTLYQIVQKYSNLYCERTLVEFYLSNLHLQVEITVRQWKPWVCMTSFIYTNLLLKAVNSWRISVTQSIGKRKGAGVYFKQTMFSRGKVAGFVVNWDPRHSSCKAFLFSLKFHGTP